MADITVHGNATAEAVLKYTPSGSAVLNFDLAEDHNKKDAQGQWQKDGTTFYRVTVWGAAAETLAGQIFQGTRVLVAGRFRGGQFDGRNGTVRTYEVTANHVGIIPRGDHGGRPAPTHQPPPTQTGGWGNNQPAGSPEWGGGAHHDEAPF